jgi:hypothetical protein
MESGTAAALVTAASWCEANHVPYAVGGSAMLDLLGLNVEVADIDLVMPGEARSLLEAAPWPRLAPKAPSPLFNSDWLLRYDIGGTTVECIGSMRVLIDGRSRLVPWRGGGKVNIAGRELPLAPPNVWYHVYRAYRPERADDLGELIGEQSIAAGARALGLASG